MSQNHTLHFPIYTLWILTLSIWRRKNHVVVSHIKIFGIGSTLLQYFFFLSIPFCHWTQVHGVANDTIKFVQNIINTEINSATDNPVSFPWYKDEKTKLLHESRCANLTQRTWVMFLDGCTRWYLLKEVRPFQVGISMVNTQQRYACLWLIKHLFSVFLVDFALFTFIALSFLLGFGLFSHCSPWAGLYQWEEDWKVV